MLRGIGYVVARRDHGDPEEPHDWALFIEAFFCRLMARIANRSDLHRRGPPERQQQWLHDRESASAKRPR